MSFRYRNSFYTRPHISGFLFGLTTSLIQYAGLFIGGNLAGCLIGSVFILGIDFLIKPYIDTVWLTIGILFGTGIIGALVMLKWERTFVIIGTSLCGQ